MEIQGNFQENYLEKRRICLRVNTQIKENMLKVKSNSNSIQIDSKSKISDSTASKTSKKRGRPKKLRSKEELAKIEQAKKCKMSLEEKQEMKLKIQKEREAAKKSEGPKNTERYYCSNKDLHKKLLVWRNSDANGLKVLKQVDGKLVATKTDDTQEGHEAYVDGTKYFVKIPKSIDKLNFIASTKLESDEEKANAKKDYFKALHTKAKAQIEEMAKDGIIQEAKFFSQTKDYIIHDITSVVRKEGWTFNYDIVEDRIITNEVGEIMLKIGRKLLNHSNFRNYDIELKEDMLMFGCSKLIKGLKNYNFKFSNPFSWFTQAFWNSYLTSLFRHYKQLNIKKDLMKKLSQELETYNGMDPRSSLNKAIKSYLGDEFAIED